MPNASRLIPSKKNSTQYNKPFKRVRKSTLINDIYKRDHNKQGSYGNENEKEQGVVVLPVILLPSFQEADNKKSNGKIHGFTEKSKQDQMMKISHLQKMWCNIRNNAVHHQLAHSGNR